jgi:alpha-beta hydrolase superfamily lysophospholipase
MNAVVEARHALAAADGHSIDVHTWEGERPARAVVQVAHGMGEHARRYRELAEALVRAGCAVVASEHRGHGEAAARSGTQGDLGPGGFPAVVGDLLTVSDFVAQRHPGLPLLLLGHSMGSFAVLVYLLDHGHRLAGAALTGTVALDLAEGGGSSAWKLGKGAAVAPVPVVARRTPYDWLSRDEAQVDAYIADPLCGFRLRPASRQSMYAAYARTTRPEALRGIPAGLPLYLFVGEDDAMHRQLAYFDPLVARLREAGLTGVSTRVYEGARHEVLHDTRRAEVYADLAAWIDRALSSTTRPA